MDMQISGNSHLNGGAEESGGAQVIPLMLEDNAVPDAGNGASLTDAVAATASQLHEQVDDKMQELRNKAVSLQQQQHGALAAHEARLQDAERQAQAAERQAQAAEQRAQGLEQVLAEMGEQVSALVRSMDELRSKVAALGDIRQEVATSIAPLQEEVKDLKEHPRAGSSKMLKIVVFLIIVIGGYSIIGKPGWSTVMEMLPPSITGWF